MITLMQAQNSDKERLWNLLQKYLYEMTNYYPDEMDIDCNYTYRYFDAYFAEPERKAYFIYEDEVPVGFVMINPYSYIEHHPDNVIAEFTIFPSYRHKHIALRAAQKLLEEHPGKWEIKYNELNSSARKLWSTLTAPYNAHIFHLDDNETVLEFSNC